MRPTISLHTFDPAMAAAWRRAFPSDERVRIVEDDILAGPVDAVVSPANSFGYMDGGIDLAYRNFFGPEIQRRVQTKIRDDHFGELPVGQAIVVATGHAAIPFLVTAPTMRVPGRVGDTVNVYLAFRAALLSVIAHNTASAALIREVRAPALGTGVGAVPLDRAARQMHAAYVSAFEPPEWLDDPARILLHHEQLRS